MCVIFSHPGPLYEQTQRIVETWTRAGLLKESIWVVRGEERESDDGVLVGMSGGTPISVSAELSARSLRNLRAVSLLLVGPDDDTADLPTGAEDLVAQAPHNVRAAEAGIPFVGGILAATTQGCEIPSKCFHPGWHFNLIVSPEDCTSDDRMGVEVTAGNIAAVTATTLVTCAGMWNWSDGAFIDGIRVPGGDRNAQVQLARAYVRVADGGFVLDDIADAALSLDQASGSWPLPTSASRRHEVADDPQGQVANVAEDFIRHYELGFTPLAAPATEPRRRLSIWEGIKLFISTLWDVIRNLPSRWIAKKQIEVEDSVLKFFSAHTFGADSSVVLTLRGRSLSADPSQPAGTDRLEAIERLDMPGSDVIVPEPMLWSGFWTVGCGLADGSDFPAGMDPPVRGTARLLVPMPDYIAPDAGEASSFTHELLPGARLSGVDAFGATELGRRLHELLRQRQAASDPATSAQDAREESSEAADGGPVSAPSAPVNALTAPPLPALETLTGDQVEEILAALEQWEAASHKNVSFSWLVGKAVGEGVVAASDELADALEVISRGEPADEPSEDEKHQTAKFGRFIRIALLMVLAGIGLGLGLFFGGIITLVVLVIALPCLLLVSGIGTLRRFLRYSTEQARAEFQRNRAISAYWFAFDRAYHASVGVARFSSLYRQYLDWAITLSVLVRQPWGSLVGPPDAGPLDEIEHPLSMTVAVAEMPADRFQRRVAAARQIVITPGWLRTAFERHVQLSMARYRDLMHVTDRTEADPANDVSPFDAVASTHAGTSETIYRPRSQVRHDALAVRFAVAARGEQATQILADVLEESLDELFSSVTVPPPAGKGLTGDGPTAFLSYLVPTTDRMAKEFPASCFTFDSMQEPAEMELALPSYVETPPPAPRLAVALATTPIEYGHRFIIGSHRLDLSAASVLTDVALVSHPQPPAPAEPEPVTADDGDGPIP